MNKSGNIDKNVVSMILRAQKNNNYISVLTYDDLEYCGKIIYFDGKSFKIDSADEVIFTENVKCAKILSDEEYMSINEKSKKLKELFEDYLYDRVIIITKYSKIDSVVFDVSENGISVVSDEEKDLFINYDIIVSIKVVKDNNLIFEDKKYFDECSDCSEEIQTKDECECKEYIPNAWEQCIIEGDKDLIVDFCNDKNRMHDLGYSEDEIEKLKKQTNTIGKRKNNSNYEIAKRLNAIQHNKNGLALKYYEAALSDKSTSPGEFSKLLNSLASIYWKENKEKFYLFFNEYRSTLINNPSYCNCYANLLSEKKKWNELKEFLPELKKFENSDILIENFDNLINYYEEIDKRGFCLESFAAYQNCINNNSNNEEDDDFDELVVLNKLPDRSAYRELLRYYVKTENYESYLSIAEYFLFDIIKEKYLVAELEKVLINSDDCCTFRLLPYIPVLWCNSKLAAKYKNALAVNAERKDKVVFPSLENTDVISFYEKNAEIVKSYSAFNDFEMCIIDNDFEGITKYINDESGLINLNYSSDIISDMHKIDFSEYTEQSEKMNNMQKLITFQGNKNHSAERFIFEASYDNPVNMICRLFPLLFEENRGELALAIFDFMPKLKNISVTKQHYLTALLLAADDERFWNEAFVDWERCKNKKIIDRLALIAKDKGDTVCSKKMRNFARSLERNKLEKAIISGDQVTARSIIMKPSELIEMEYTDEEIARMKKVFNTISFRRGSTNLEIARRIFLIQKNKNEIARSYFEKALKNADSSIAAAKDLMNIYASQDEHENIIRIYEDFLSDEPFNRQYGLLYSQALFETEKYKEMIEFWQEHYYLDEEYPLYMNLLYSICISNNSMGVSADDFSYIHNASLKNNSRSEIVFKYISLRLQRELSDNKVEEITTFLNKYCYSFSDENFDNLSELLKDVDKSFFNKAERNLLLALATGENIQELLLKWYKAIENQYDLHIKVNIIIRICSYFHEAEGCFFEVVLDLYRKAVETENSESLLKRIFLLISQNVKTKENEESLIQFIKEYRIVVDGENLTKFCTMFSEENHIEEMYRFYIINSESVLNKKVADYYEQYFNEGLSITEFLYDNNMLDEYKAEKLLYVLDEFCKFDINDNRHCIAYIRLYYCMKMYNEAEILAFIVDDLYRCNDEFENSLKLEISIDKINLFEIIKRILTVENLRRIDEFCNKWKNYLVINAFDEDYYDELCEVLSQNSDDNDAIDDDWQNSFAKLFICNNTDVAYWRYMRMIAKNWDIKAIKNIECHIKHLSGLSVSAELSEAVSSGNIEDAIDIIIMMHNSSRNDKVTAQRQLNNLVMSDEFSKSDIKNIKNLFAAIKTAFDFLNEDSSFTWNAFKTATNLAIATGNVREYIRIFSRELTATLAGAKQCTALIAKLMTDADVSNVEDVKAIREYISSNINNAPHKKLVLDLSENYDGTVLDKSIWYVMWLVAEDFGNIININIFAKFYIRCTFKGEENAALAALNIIQKYFPNDSIIYYFMSLIWKNISGDQSVINYYKYMFEYIRMKAKSAIGPLKTYIKKMIYGEYCIKYYDVAGNIPESSVMTINKIGFKKIAFSQIKNYCETIESRFRDTEYSELPKILFKAYFADDWSDLIRYKPSIELIEKYELLKFPSREQDYTGIDIVRSTMKVLTYAEDAGYDNRIDRMWNQFPFLKNKYYDFKNIFSKLSFEQKKLAIRLWSVDIFNNAVIEQYGKEIISEPDVSAVLNLYQFMEPKIISRIFETQLCRNALYLLGADSARGILETILTLYDGAEALYGAFLKENSSDKSETNIDYKYDSAFVECVTYRNNYLAAYESVFGRYIADNNTAQREAAPAKCNIQLPKALSKYIFYTEYFNSEKDRKIIGPITVFEFINTITEALCDKDRFEKLDYVIESVVSQYKYANIIAYCVIKIAKNEYEAAFNKIEASLKETCLAGIMHSYLFLASLYTDKIISAKARKLSVNVKEFAIMNKSKFNQNLDFINENKILDLNDGDKYFRLPAELENYNKNKLLPKNTDKEVLPDSTQNDDKALSELPEENNASVATAKPSFAAINDDIIDYETCFEMAFVKQTIEQNNSCKRGGELSNISTNNLSIRKMYGYLLKTYDRFKEGRVSEDENLYRLCFRIGLSVMSTNTYDGDKNQLLLDTLALLRDEKDFHTFSDYYDIVEYLKEYLKSFDSLDAMMRGLQNDIKKFKKLVYVFECCNDKIDVKGKEQLSDAAKALNLLLNNSEEYYRLNDTEKLKDYLQECISKSVKYKKGLFISIIDEYISKVNHRLCEINRQANLQLFVDGQDDEKNTVCVWRREMRSGAITGYVKNEGGATADQVHLKITFNKLCEYNYKIDNIDPQEMISFRVPLKIENFINNKIEWSAEVSAYSCEKHYYDGNISLELSDEQINYGSMKYLNTQHKTEGDAFVGRVNEKTTLNNYYGPNVNAFDFPSMRIEGLRRSGKSSLMDYFYKKIKTRDDVVIYRVDAQSQNKISFALIRGIVKGEDFDDDFTKKWVEVSERDDWYNYLYDFYMELYELNGKKKILVIMDEMEAAFYSNEMSEKEEEIVYGVIRSLIQSSERQVSFIFIGSDKLLTSCIEMKRESQLFQQLYSIKVGRMNECDIKEIFYKYSQSGDVKFTDEAVETIWNYTNGLVYFAKYIGRSAVDLILKDEEFSTRKFVYVSDIVRTTEKFVKGEINRDAIGLLDKNVDTVRKKILESMAEIMEIRNCYLDVGKILNGYNNLISRELENSKMEETLFALREDEMINHLKVLTEMQFLIKNPDVESYTFTSEIYRLYFRKSNKSCRKFLRIR